MLALRLLENLFMPVTISLLALGEGGRRTWSWGVVEKKQLFSICAAAATRWWRAAGVVQKLAGDLDLVAWEGDTLCFIEVKTRTSRNVATAESAIDDDKTRVLRRMARQYLLALPVAPDQVRFDVLSIYYQAKSPRIFNSSAVRSIGAERSRTC